MKDNFIHVCFIIDESGSMYGSEADVIGGVKKTIEDQKKVKEGKCAVSLYRFSNDVKKEFIGMDVNEVPEFTYSPGGCTAMNDGIGTAIDDIGKWLDGMKEEEKPSKNLIVIMTDGQENSSKEYTASQVKEKIKEQTEKYNWEFVYMGTDITSATDADNLGIKTRGFSTKGNIDKYYTNLSLSASNYRMAKSAIEADEAMNTLGTKLADMTASYETSIGHKIK